MGICFSKRNFSVDPGKESTNWDVIMWMDHRAKLEAEKINQIGHPVLQSVGGTISVEMQTPKLKWLKKNKPEVWERAVDFFDLSDFLTWKATGSKVRSLCSTVCKWTYHGDGSGGGWNSSYFKSIGLEELVEEMFSRIGNEIIAPGNLVGYLLPGVIDQMKLGK